MLVVGFPAGAFQTNCYLVAAGEGEPCVVVDPGQDAAGGVAEAVRKYNLSPVAVLLTHGHLDHTFSVTPVCDGNGIPAWIHPADRHLLNDPMAGMSPQAAAMFGAFPMREPDEVREMTDGSALDLAGLTLTVDHTPGHTKGSVVFRTATPEGGLLLFAGDTLFAGSIGRTDLPGGSMAEMTESLRTKILPLPDETVVLPGHGGTTTVGRERAANPFLTGVVDLTDPSSAHTGRGKGI